jgi:serine phosphatase RsbU (regulator of sigma subunit)
VADLPFPFTPGDGTTTAAIADGMFGVLEHMAEHLTDLEQKGRALTANYQHLDEQIQLASQVQQAMLPEADTAPRGVKLRSLYRPVDRVSGDIYDIVRLDETHVGISIADATGHGVPAALLTVFIKRAFKSKETFNGSYRLLRPAETLGRLNRELRDMRMRQCPYITALHAVYDEVTRRLTVARGGMPYPVLIPAGGVPRQLCSHGPLLGALPDAMFEEIEIDLNPGDRLLLFTDGLTSLLCGRDPNAPAHDITEIPWFAEAASQPLDGSLASIDELLHNSPPTAWCGDDLTLVGLEIEE